jgi:valyl-tRNA synthetase
MAKNKYDFNVVEEKWKKYWEKEGIYKADFKNKKVYSVDNPPPTVSGAMHIGHAFSYSQQDFLVRFHRMLDGSAFFPFGTDDNGLPTERLVEKINKVKSKDMSRADFIELCLKTLKKITPDFIQDWKDLGMSCDFDVCYSTIDKNSQKLSQKSFLELYEKGEVYKKEFPTIWCPECQTSIAQAELEDKEQGSLFSTLKFKCEGKDLLIATTRPELLGACVAVFVNPKDDRYKKLVGKKAKVPLFDFEVPILEDDSAEIDKGTGVLMICSYGDKFDVDAINRHKLEPKVVFEKDGTLNLDNYVGLKIKEARKKILEDLDKAGLIKEQKQIEHVVNVHDKCGTEIEFLPTDQWFIGLLDKKKKFIGQAKKINWYPKFMHKRYDNWVNGLEWDWSISRDRHFGIPIPVWFCEDCEKIIVADEKELPVDPLQTKKKCPNCKKDAVPEKKVLDTWATSSLTPKIASSLVGDKIKLPYSLRPQAHDIIRTWAFYTIVKAYLHEGEIPWKDIAISGNVSLKGEKMSKSKGNVIDPKDVLEKYGSDAMRFWAAGSKLGNDLDYQEQDLVAGKKFVNKLLNASRFVFMNLEDFDGKKPKKLEKIDELFLEKIDILVNSVTHRFEKYEYSKARSNVEQFFWKDFADNYLEIVKKRVYQGKGEKRKSAQYALYAGLLAMLKMVAPFMPFVTEEIYQEHFKKFEKDVSIHVSSWPEGKELDKYDKLLDHFVGVLTDVRQAKTKANKAMNAEIILSLEKDVLKKFEGLIDDLQNVTNAKEIKEGKFKVEFV